MQIICGSGALAAIGIPASQGAAWLRPYRACGANCFDLHQNFAFGGFGARNLGHNQLVPVARLSGFLNPDGPHGRSIHLISPFSAKE
jgi:hypothetical protein